MKPKHCLFLLLMSLSMVWGCKISGTVMDENGVGIKGVKIELSGKINLDTQTDGKGHYEFKNSGISNGAFLVKPVSDVDTFAPGSISVKGTFIDVENVDFRSVTPDTVVDFTPSAINSPTFMDLLTLLFRSAPENGPIETPVESWSVLAPGVGGIGASICPLCINQMYLYDNLAMLDEPLTPEMFNQFWKKGQVGIEGDSVFQLTPKAFYPDYSWKKLIADFQNRGYDVPIDYKPPRTLTAQINWDEYHVPHIVGDTVEDVSYGVGYATVHSSMFEMLLIRLIGTTGLLQMGLDLQSLDFSDLSGLFTELKGYALINYTHAEMMDSMDPAVCEEQMGPLCQEVLSTLVAYSQGINQAMQQRFPVFKLFEIYDIPWPKWDVTDSVAAGLAITGVFGDPGGDQLSNLEKYKTFAAQFGADKAQSIYDDYKLRNVPVDISTVTAHTPFPNPVYADGTNESDPQREIDPDSIAWVDNPETGSASLLKESKPHASNWMVVSAGKSRSGRPLLVGGPQMAYFEPNIFFEFDARTTDASFQITGVSLPGLYMAAFAGNAHNGVWSPTAAGGKTADIFIEKLCLPDGDDPVPADSLYYWHNNECKPMRLRQNGVPFTVHGPVMDRATVNGHPVAIVKCSNHPQKIGQSIFPYYLIAKGNVKTAQEFIDSMEMFTLALNYAYINESESAYINTGHYPVRAEGAQSDFPTWGTGQWDWQGVISMDQRPHVINPASGYMVSWNNQAAPQFYLSDGGFQRVQLLDRLMRSQTYFDLASLAEVSHLASLQDGYAITFVPLLLKYVEEVPDLEDGPPKEMLGVLSDWTALNQARRLDWDEDGLFDSAGPAIMDEIMVCLKSVLEQNLGISLGDFNFPSGTGSAYQDGSASIILMLLKRALQNGDEIATVNDALLNCDNGTFSGCRSLIVTALVQAEKNLSEAYQTETPSEWHKPAEKLQLTPLEMFPNNHKKWHWQNRPTYQQVATVH